MSPRLVPVALAAAALAFTACDSLRAPRPATADGGCTRCHGDAARVVEDDVDPAAPAMPPRGTTGATGSDQRRVGAHERHVLDTVLTAKLTCATCHGPLPTSTGHANGTVNLQFSGRAVLNGATPAFDPETGTCASVYCHGNFRGGNADNRPEWADPRAQVCGSCHGTPTNPRPLIAAHPDVDANSCGNCHVGYGFLSVNPDTHINGSLEVASQHPAGWADPRQHGLAAKFQTPDPTQANGIEACDLCHGDNGQGPIGGGSARACDACHAPAGFADWRTDCTFCHGDRATGAPFPPQDVLDGTSGVRVGAHASHVNGPGAIMAPLDCTACHPQTWTIAYDPGHIDAGTATVRTLAGDDHGWDRTFASAQGQGTCAAAACHGANLAPTSRGAASEPVWTLADGSQRTCGSCHRAPPQDPRHLRATASPASCRPCHAGTVDASGNILVSGGLHVNGAADIPSATCTSCHGDPGRVVGAGEDANVAAAPPLDRLGGNGPAVGAHDAHLRRTDLRAAKLGCAECHEVPSSVTHANGVTNLPFGALARTGTPPSSPPTFTAGRTCNNTYCHGATLGAGGALTAPGWNAGPTARDCGACHGAPPPSPHPASTACASCHGAGYAQGAVTGAGLATHIDGQLQLLALACTSCHGQLGTGADTGANPVAAAPPLGLAGETATTARAVGAHRSHLAKTTFRPTAIPCSECHVVPVSTSHADGAKLLAFGGLAAPAPLQPGFDGTACSNTYCHGATLGGGQTSVAWTGTFAATGSTLSCASCHGFPPPAPHPANSGCTGCHGPLAGAAHIDGDVDLVNFTCTSCHGQPGTGADTGANPVAAAPPLGLAGETATTARAVAAHRPHLGKTNFRAAAIACADCHDVPSAIPHADGVKRVTFGPASSLAKTGGLSPAFSGTACSSVYCHGASLGGGPASVTWAGTYGPTGTTLGCTSCHGAPPPPPHPANAACDACHGAGYSATTVVLATHIDGSVNLVGLSCTSCHGQPQAGVPDTGANPVAAAPPLGTAGETDTTVRAVGAHRAHLQKTSFRPTSITCADCHTAVPSSTSHSDGTRQLGFGPAGSLAKTGGLVPAFDGTGCASVYCHGASLGGGPASVTWTGTFAATGSTLSCTSCHGFPPPAPHVQNSSCTNCHGPLVGANHLDGTLDLLALTCASCHGATGTGALTGANPVGAAPPLGLAGETATTARAVAAHRAHLEKSNFRSAPIVCADCHTTVPTSTSHADGTKQLGFGPAGSLARTGGLAPSFTGTTCTNVYCHGASVGNATPATWAGTYSATLTQTTLGCTSCHGDPPALPHPQATDCATCHGAGYSATAVNRATHVDGTLQRPPAGCTACHGDPARTGTDANGQALAPAPPRDSSGATATTAQGVGAHQAHLLGGALAAAVACAECHQGVIPAGTDTAHANGAANVQFGPLAGQGTATPAYSAGTCASVYCHGATLVGGTNKTPSWTGANQAACGTCHGVPPATSSHAGFTVGTNCGACHPGYGVPPAVNAAVHVNGQLDGGEGGAVCASCHTSQFERMNGSVTAGVGSRHAIGTDPAVNTAQADSGITWASPLANQAPGARSCVNMCHDDHPHTLTTPPTTTHDNNVYVDARTQASRAATSATSADKARTDWSATAPNGLCLSCHQFPVESGGTPARPALSPAAYDASAHQFTTAAGVTWIYTLHDGSTFNRDCTKCHSAEATPNATGGGTLGGPHWSPNRFLLSGTYNPAGTPSAFQCYGCHGNGTVGTDRSGKNIATQIAKARSHPANADAVHDSVAELNQAAWGNQLGGRARHASCMDCHDVHEAKPGTHSIRSNLAGPASSGAWGAALTTNPAFWGTTSAASFTKKVIVDGADPLATLCFKCHSTYWWGTGTPPTSPSLGAAATDQAREFNPANTGSFAGGTSTNWQNGETAGGYHPVLAAAGNNLGAVRLTNLVTTPIAWSTTQRNLMTCIDCHDSDTEADPNGPHGSANAFLLRGPNAVWNNTISAGTGTMPANVFCRNCHSATYANSRFPAHTRGDHNIPCMKCHAAVPHGGPRPGMLIAPAGANANVGGQIAGWDTAAPYNNSGTGNRLYLFSYPANNTSNWAQGNCGCNGTGH